MEFRRLLAFVALLAGLAACAQQTSAPQAARGTNVALPPAIARAVGPAYPDAVLNAYVDGVGQRLVRAAGLAGPYRFYVLDQPVPNAHAVAGYVFVTRGLLALLEDEAELAAAMGHEVGHLVQGHAAQRARARQGVLEAAVDATLASGSVNVGRSVAQDGLLALRRYSRDQELEADRLALTYLAKAGYRTDAMTSLIDRLRRQAQFEALVMGEQPDVGDRPSAMSTHPAPVERQAALAGASSAGQSNQKAYFAAIDGMSVDDPPSEGFVRGRTFVHPTLRLSFTVPPGFRLFNETDGVLAVGPDRALMFFSCTSDTVDGPLDDWMRNKMKPTPTDIQATQIGGAEAAIGARPRGADTGMGQARYVIIRHGPRVCFFNLLSEGPDRDRQIAAMVAATRSFHELSAAEAASLRPYRLRIVSPAGSSAEQIAARLPYPDLKLERLLVLNAARSPAELTGRSEIKTVEP